MGPGPPRCLRAPSAPSPTMPTRASGTGVGFAALFLGRGQAEKAPSSPFTPPSHPPFGRQLTASGLSYVCRAGVFTGYQNSTGKAVQTAGSYESEGYGEDTAQGRAPKIFLPCSLPREWGRGGKGAAPYPSPPPGARSRDQPDVRGAAEIRPA